jgi:hypothetical protein
MWTAICFVPVLPAMALSPAAVLIGTRLTEM